MPNSPASSGRGGDAFTTYLAQAVAQGGEQSQTSEANASGAAVAGFIDDAESAPDASASSATSGVSPAGRASDDPVAEFLAMFGAPVLPPPTSATAQAADGAKLLDLAPTGGRSAGKNLPNLQVLLAGPSAVASPEDGSTAGSVSGLDLGMLSTATYAADPTPSGPAALPAPKPSPILSTAVPPLAVPGQESSLMAARGHAASGSAAAVMQNGLGSAGWTQELGDKLLWVVGRQGQTAELILNPPSLGTVEVRLNLSGGDATAQFFAASSQVRDALEAALPRLRELMDGAGISLGQAMVSDQSFAQQDRLARGGQAGRQDGVGSDGLAEAAPPVQTARVAHAPLLDYFV